jgi:threonine/homoserine/homoserine lactone efflux protein
VRGGRREALLVTVGNSVGILAWAVFAAVGVAAVVAASASLFTTIKLAGAIVLIVLGLQGLLARKTAAPPPPPGTALRQGLITSLANPKLAVFFVALFPQFVPAGAPVLPRALAMAGMVVALDLVWYSALAYCVARTRRAFAQRPWLARAERLTGGVLVALGVRLALERR